MRHLLSQIWGGSGGLKHAAPPKEGYSSSTVGVHDLASRCRLAQVLRGQGAKRGDQRWAACAGQDRANDPGGVPSLGVWTRNPHSICDQGPHPCGRGTASGELWKVMVADVEIKITLQEEVLHCSVEQSCILHGVVPPNASVWVEVKLHFENVVCRGTTLR